MYVAQWGIWKLLNRSDKWGLKILISQTQLSRGAKYVTQTQ